MFITEGIRQYQGRCISLTTTDKPFTKRIGSPIRLNASLMYTSLLNYIILDDGLSTYASSALIEILSSQSSSLLYYLNSLDEDTGDALLSVS